MRVRSASWLVVLASLALAACSATEVIVPSPSMTHPVLQNPPGTAFVRPSPAASSDPIASERSSMPPGFPLPDGAQPALLDDDPTVIGHWFVPTLGFDVYNFYVDELPRAGYPIVGLYPGDIGAIIRFDGGSQILQVMMTGEENETDLTLRTDVP